MPTVDIYSKQQVDALIAGAGGLPDPTSASAGDVLTLDSNKDPAWSAPSSGGITKHTYSTFAALYADVLTHSDGILVYNGPILTSDGGTSKCQTVNAYLDTSNDLYCEATFIQTYNATNLRVYSAKFTINNTTGATASGYITYHNMSGYNTSSSSPATVKGYYVTEAQNFAIENLALYY